MTSLLRYTTLMNIYSLQQELPTANEERSMSVWGEILLEQDTWRCYSSEHHVDIQVWIDRFLRLHAMQPGWLTPESLAFRPTQIISGRAPSYTMWGAVFTNGAVIRVANTTQENWLLFIANDVAAAYRYPEGWVHTTEFFGRTQDATPGST